MLLLETKFLFNFSRQFSTSLIRKAYWNKDWKPQPYPKTEEERLASAKKYGLLPIEYKPIPDNGDGLGDYPDLKPVSPEGRDPFYPWDFPEYRRNFNEVLHENHHLYTEDRINANDNPKYPLYIQFSCFMGALGILALLFVLGEDACFLPLAKKHMPAPGVKNYSYAAP